MLLYKIWKGLNGLQALLFVWLLLPKHLQSFMFVLTVYIPVMIMVVVIGWYGYVMHHITERKDFIESLLIMIVSVVLSAYLDYLFLWKSIALNVIIPCQLAVLAIHVIYYRSKNKGI